MSQHTATAIEKVDEFMIQSAPLLFLLVGAVLLVCGLFSAICVP